MKSFSFGATEVKLLILVGYFFIHFLMYMVIFGAIVNYNLEIFDYFYCELSGHDPNDPCDDSVLVLPASIALLVFTVVLNAVTPLMLLMFVVNVKELKEKCRSGK